MVLDTEKQICSNGKQEKLFYVIENLCLFSLLKCLSLDCTDRRWFRLGKVGFQRYQMPIFQFENVVVDNTSPLSNIVQLM